MDELKKYLKKNKLTIKKFAEIIEYGRGNLSAMLRGKFKPSLKTALKIEQATNGEVSVQKLARGE